VGQQLPHLTAVGTAVRSLHWVMALVKVRSSVKVKVRISDGQDI